MDTSASKSRVSRSIPPVIRPYPSAALTRTVAGAPAFRPGSRRRRRLETYT
ncbi:hypothetical protein ACQP2K_06545 [Microbispora siamensis]